MKFIRFLMAIFFSIALAACGGSGGGSTPATYGVSGTVTLSGAALAGATITLTGGTIATTDASGNYSFTGLANGNYTVTPTKAGTVFSPTSLAVSVSGANVTGTNFTATIGATYSISGAVSGAVQSGVTITLSGAGSATTTTNASGNYSFSDIANGSYAVTPSLTGYTFSPANSAAVVSGADITGKNFVTLTGGSENLTGKIAFIVSKDEAAHQRAVYVMDTAGRNLKQLTDYSIGAQHPVWSPDGKRIAFAAIKDGGIYTINADGTNLTRIVYKTVYDQYTGTSNIAANDNPSWSPDGSKIVYESFGDEDSGTIVANVNLYVVSSGGGTPTKLTSDLSYEGMPSWSPDGSKIAFVFFRYESTNYGNYQILTMNADGSNKVQWTNSDITWNNLNPDWSPDGFKIIFTGDGNDHQGIFCIDLGKTTRTFIGANLGSNPKWSPDGTKIITNGWYSEGNISGMRIWITNADGSNSKKIDTPIDMSAREPDWTSQ